MSWLSDLRESYRVLGGAKFWALISGTISWIAIGVWLMMTATWPGQCDHEGRKLIGHFKQLYCSPDLLSGGLTEYGLFAWLWSMPLFVVGLILWAILRKSRTANLSIHFDEAE